MKRSDWYLIGMMLCVANANPGGALSASIVMFIAYIVECKRGGDTLENEPEEG